MQLSRAATDPFDSSLAALRACARDAERAERAIERRYA
jgi:hypothetical protein